MDAHRSHKPRRLDRYQLGPPNFPSLAQLESALGYELRGWAFESLRTGQTKDVVMFLKVGSVHEMQKEYLQSASKVGKISAGSFVKVLRYDEYTFTIQRCSEQGVIHKNSYPYKIRKESLMERI